MICNVLTLYFFVHRPNSRLGPGENLHGPSNYQDYGDILQPGPRLYSDSNVSKFSNFYRPPSRGQLIVTDKNHPNINQHPSKFPGDVTQGSIPAHEKHVQHSLETQRGLSQSQEQEHLIRNNTGNYQVIHKTQNMNFGEKWNYSDESGLGKHNVNINRTNVNSRQEMPLSGGNYGNSSYAYRDPVFSAMAGKRPVKSLSQQPNSAKV